MDQIGRQARLPDGYVDKGTKLSVVPWTDVRRRLEESEFFWFATATPDGEPHARPIWGAWIDETFYFDGGVDRTRWGRDLLANPRIEVHLPSAEEVVIVTGTFSRENDLDADSFKRVQASYLSRYKSYQPEDPDGLFMVRPVSALAWTVFPGNVTRFTFQSS